MTYILLYIAALIAAMVGVGVIVAKQPRIGTTTDTQNDQDDLFGYSIHPDTTRDPAYSNFSWNVWHIDHRD